MNNELSRAALMAVAGGVIAGVSFIAGKREGSTVGVKKLDVAINIGYAKGLIEGYMKAKEKYDVGNEEGK